MAGGALPSFPCRRSSRLDPAKTLQNNSTIEGKSESFLPAGFGPFAAQGEQRHIESENPVFIQTGGAIGFRDPPFRNRPSLAECRFELAAGHHGSGHVHMKTVPRWGRPEKPR